MGKFDKEEVANKTGDGHHYRLTEPLTYSPDDGEAITVSAGFWTDAASVPRIFWRVYPPFGKYFKAAVLHDFLYFRGLFIRSKCDDLFREAILACGCSRFTAWTLYTGVRIGGWKAYGDYRRKTKKMEAIQ
jgi:hypothetical protein